MIDRYPKVHPGYVSIPKVSIAFRTCPFKSDYVLCIIYMKILILEGYYVGKKKVDERGGQEFLYICFYLYKINLQQFLHFLLLRLYGTFI